MPIQNDTPRSKSGPTPRGGVKRVRLSPWTSPAAKTAIQNWTEESQAVDPKWSDGDTLAAMVEVCLGTRVRPVALKTSPAAENPAPSPA